MVKSNKNKSEYFIHNYNGEEKKVTERTHFQSEASGQGQWSALVSGAVILNGLRHTTLSGMEFGYFVLAISLVSFSLSLSKILEKSPAFSKIKNVSTNRSLFSPLL